MNEKRVRELVEQFRQQKILVVGDFFMDHYVRGVVERLNPEAPVPILAAREEYSMTGGAGNVAKNAAALGAATVLTSVVGEGLEATFLEEIAGREQYTTRLLHDAQRQTIRKVRFLVGSQQLLRVDYEKVQDLAGAIEDELLNIIEEEMSEGVTGVVISDYAKGVITERVARGVIKAARKRTIPVAADVKPSRAAFITQATLISPNRKEAHEFLGLNQEDRGGYEPQQLAEKLRRKIKADVFVTLGAEGMYVRAENIDQLVPQHHTPEVFDPSGAGDTAIVALLLARLGGANPVEAAELANAAAAVEVSKLGSVGVTAKEVLDMILHRHQ
jgi:D-beta-D-heptose 7-phosphate kinase/D-beta-D-heptose 1-phosphate adenosyltransferase